MTHNPSVFDKTMFRECFSPNTCFSKHEVKSFSLLKTKTCTKMQWVTAPSCGAKRGI